jgi:hypothetical protein
LVAGSGGVPPGLIQAYQALVQAATENAELPTLPDIHPEDWLRGDVAFGLAGGSLRPGFIVPSGTPMVFALAGVADPTAALRDLAILERQLLPPKAVSEVDVAGFTFRQLAVGSDPDQVLTYGLADDWLYAISGGGDPADVVGAAQTGDTLDAANPRFDLVRRALRSDGFNLFVDLEAGRTLLEQLATTSDPRTYEQQVKPFVAPLRALGGSWWVDDDGSGQPHGQFFLAIGGG